MTIEYKDSKRITAVSSDWTTDVTSNITWSTTGKVGWDISGTTISRTGSAGWSTSKIQSTDTFTVGDGAFMIEFSGIANDLNSTMIGFNKGTLGYHHGSGTPLNNSDFAIYVAGGSRVEVYESGSKNYDSGGSRNANDKFRIEVSNSGVVKYYLQEGGTGSFDLKHTSSSTASGTYFIQANAYASTAEVTVHSKTVATAVAKPTDIQDNSILVEKDTARRYWFSKPTTFEQNFDSNTGHTVNQTTVNGWYAEDYTKIAYDGTNHYLKYAAMGSTNWGASFDLQQSGNNGVGSAINSSKWTLRFKWHILTNSGSTSNGSQGAFGISSVPATTLNSQDFMGFSMRQHASGGEVGLFNAALDNNNPMNQGTSAKKFVTGNLSAGTTYYAEIIRDGDKCTTTLRTGSHTGTQVGSMERTVTGISGLRYLYYKAQQDSGSATHTSYIDDIDFINGADTWTMTPTYQTDFSSSTGWTFKDSAKASISGGTLSFNFEDNSGDDDSCYYDLGSTMSDTQWLLRFKINWSTFDDNSRCWFGLASNSTAQNSNKDFIGLLTHRYNSISQFETMDINGSTLTFEGEANSNGTATDHSGGTGNNISTGTDYYIEIRRKSDTTYDVRVFDNANYSGTPTYSIEGTMSANTISGLQYIMFYNRNDHNTAYNQEGIIDDLSFYNGVNTVN